MVVLQSLSKQLLFSFILVHCSYKITRFTLDLESLEHRPFLRKVREAWKNKGIFYNVYPSQGKVRWKNYLVSISFSLTISTVVRRVVALFVLSKFELQALLCGITSIMCTTHLLGSIFFTYFCMWNGGQGRSGCFWLPFRKKSGNSQEILIHVLGMNPINRAIRMTCVELSMRMFLSVSYVGEWFIVNSTRRVIKVYNDNQ